MHCREEAEDDEDIITDQGDLGGCLLWGAEPNPYGSLRGWRWSEVAPPPPPSAPGPGGPQEEEEEGGSCSGGDDGSSSSSSSEGEGERLTSNQAWMCLGAAGRG